MATCVKCLEFWAMDDTCKIEMRPLYERILSTRVHWWTQFGHWTFDYLSHFLSILGDRKNYVCINESFMEPLWRITKAGCVHLLETYLFYLQSQRINEESQSMSKLHTMSCEKLIPYFQTSYLHFLSILNKHVQIAKFLNICVMKHGPLTPCIFLSIEQSNNYDASSGALHTSQLQKERIQVLGFKTLRVVNYLVTWPICPISLPYGSESSFTKLLQLSHFLEKLGKLFEGFSSIMQFLDVELYSPSFH